MKSLEPFDAESGHVNVIVETPKGFRAKYAYDQESELFQLKAFLPSGMSFPFDFGFIPGTKGEDGDPLDILVLLDEPATQGSLVRTRLVAVIEAEQTKDGKAERNDRLIGIAAATREYREIESLDQLNPNLISEIEHFFISYNQISGRIFKPVGRSGADRARKLIEAARL